MTDERTITENNSTIDAVHTPVSVPLAVSSPFTKKLNDFLATEVGVEAKRRLELMVQDSAYRTPATYTSNISQYPDKVLPFVDKHLLYLCTHPQLGADVYIDNLQLMSRIH